MKPSDSSPCWSGLAASVGLALFLSTPVKAQYTAYHDFGQVTGATLTNISVQTFGASGSTTTLNLGPVGLVDYSDDSSTGVSVTVAGPNGTDLRSGVLGAPPAASPGDALFNGVGLGFGTGIIYEGGSGGAGATTITLTGLDANLRYDIAFVGGRLAAPDFPERFTLSGVDGTPTNPSAGAVDAFTTDQDTRNNPADGAIIRWADINPGIDGTIVVTMDPEFDGKLDNIGYLAAMRLEATVPGGDTTPPTLVTTNPADDATNVATSANLLATFDETVVLTGVGTVTLKNKSGGSDIVISLPDTGVTTSGMALTIDPAASLVAGDEYAVEISSDAVEDTAGNPYAGLLETDDPNWSFTTDGTAPMGTGMYPMTAATGVLSDANLTLSFDEAVVGVGGKTITIHLAGDNSVVETIDAGSLSIVGGEVVIDPAADLLPGTAYYVNIEAGAFTDLSGNPFAGITGTTSWAFTTREPIGPGVYFLDFGETAALTENISVQTIGTADSTTELNTDPVELIQYTDGAASGIFVTVAGANGTDLRTNVLDPPAPGDPADALFNGVGLGFETGTLYEGGVSGDGVTTVTLTGLNPNARYDLAFVGGRNAAVGSDTDERFTLSGVDGTPTNTSSIGAVDAFATDQQTRGLPVPGEFVRWTDINPGSDDTIVVTVDPEYDGNLTNIAYLVAMRLEVVGAVAPLVLNISQSGGTLAFSWNGVSGMQYDLVSSTDPAAEPDPSLWAPYNDGLTTYEDIKANSLSGVALVDPTRFFALLEEPIPPLLAVNFEDNNGGFTVATTAGTDWEHGAPDAFGPGGIVNAGNGGSAICWATKLGTYAGGSGDAGFYADPTDTCLRSAVIDLTGVAGARLSFAEALDLAAGDTAVVNIIDDTDDNPATNVIAAAIYTATDAATSSAGWATVTPIAIPAAALGQLVRIEWCFSGTGDSTDDYMGWYIDDVVVTETTP